ncbi:MAG: hypothetical protein LBI37_01390 [Puniceicoccales bacterium]|nr:hypothetical protein [Puniceicoccales bacterium]
MYASLNTSGEVFVLKNKDPEEEYAHEAYQSPQNPDSQFSFSQPSRIKAAIIQDVYNSPTQTPSMLGMGVLGEKNNNGFAFINISSDTDLPKNDRTRLSVEVILDDE